MVCARRGLGYKTAMIIVTGGAGFIGSNLVAALEERARHDLVVCDRLGRGEKWRNLAKRELAAIIAPEQLMAFLGDQRWRGAIEADLPSRRDLVDHRARCRSRRAFELHPDDAALGMVHRAKRAVDLCLLGGNLRRRHRWVRR